MTLREELKKRLENDYSKAPKKYWNMNNLEMIWNENEHLYIGIDVMGVEWITALQTTRVPIFAVKCTIPQRKGNVEVNCGAINFVPIFDSIVQCRKCEKEFPAKLNIPKTSQAYSILEKLDK